MEVAAAGLPGPLGADAAPTSHQDPSGLIGGVFVSSGMPTISISNYTCMAFVKSKDRKAYISTVREASRQGRDQNCENCPFKAAIVSIPVVPASAEGTASRWVHLPRLLSSSAGQTAASAAASWASSSVNWCQVVTTAAAVVFLLFWVGLRLLHILAVIYG